jgi:dipeptidyl aminopeptidase/acylaminoacyl peptidase
MKFGVLVGSFLGLLIGGSVHAEVPVADFAKHMQYVEAAISPNGEYLAAVAVVKGRRMLSLVHLADMKGVNLDPREGDELSSFEWIGPDRLIYTLGKHIGGEVRPYATGELFTLKGDGTGAAILYGYRAGPRSTVATMIKGAEPDYGYGFVISALNNDPENALIGAIPYNGPGHSRSFDGAFSEAYRINLNTGAKQQIATSPLRDADFLADHAGRIRFAFTRDNDQKYKVFYRDAEGGEWQSLYDEGKGGDMMIPLMFNRTNESVYMKCAGANGVGGICRWDVKTRKSEPLWSAKASSKASLVETFDRQDAFAIRTHIGRPAVVLFDKAAAEASVLVTLMQQFPGEDIAITSASRDGKKVVFLASADADPGTYYLYDAERKKITALFARADWIKPTQMAAMEPVTLKARDGLELHGFLTRPSGKAEAKGLPLVVLPHGGPYGVYDEWGYESEVQLLASRGYAVLQVNFRGSGGSGEAFEKAGHGEWGAKMQDDVTDATLWTIKEGVADPKRICIYGGSYGGYAALWGAVKEPDLYKCAIGHSGIYDLRAWVKGSDVNNYQYGRSYLQMVLGSDETVLWNRSPMAHLDALKAKVMLVAGGSDERVPASQAENLHNELNKRKIDHEWLYQRTEAHGFYDETHTAEFYTKLLSFLDKQIGASSAAGAAH